MTPETMQQNVSQDVATATTNDTATKMNEQNGPTYWRSVNELAGKTEIDELIVREFPSHVDDILDPVNRRNFLKVMGASMMLAGLSSCARQPEEQIFAYAKQPEEMIPGRPNYYATTFPFLGYGLGLVATSFEGRPTKVEGLKEHPGSLGRTDTFAQASVLDLYDPDRLDTTLNRGSISTYERFVADLQKKMNELDALNGEGLRILTGSVTSPTLRWQLKKISALYSGARWHEFEPAGRENVREGSKLAFGDYYDTVLDFTKAKVILSLDSNFLVEGPGHVRYAQDYAQSRDYDENGHSMSRLYAVEVTPTLVGANADHKISVRFPDVESVARAIAEQVGVSGAGADAARTGALPQEWLSAVVADLKAHGSEAIVTVGDTQPAVVHALAHAINGALGSVQNGVVQYVPASDSADLVPGNLGELVADMNDGKVSLLIMFGGNPVYNSPADVDFSAAMQHVELRVHLTDRVNDTSEDCHWQIPMAHYLESWGDARAYDGTPSLIQPLIAPLYNGKTGIEILSALLAEENAKTHDVVQAHWTAVRGSDNFEDFWRLALGNGVIAEAAPKRVNPALKATFPAQEYIEKGAGLDIVFRPDPSVFDGSLANNGWLQELPRPLSKLTWDNAIFMHPRTAEQLHLQHEDLGTLSIGQRRVHGGVFTQIGHPKDTITVHLGYGQKFAGRVGNDHGFNAYAVRTAAQPWFATGATVEKTGKKYSLARTEEHWQIEQSLIEQAKVAEDRHLIREATMAHYAAQPDFAQKMGHPAPDRDFTLYSPDEKSFQTNWGNQWAMTIDLNRCTGCNVCTIACQSENNIPIVGKEEVINGREMHWIRVDRYYKGDFNGNVDAVHQPIPCMQCENAPCEPVCPVGATMHSDEGLNDMVYNRCVGTRYCANNCPYKVRRFNFFHYQIREGQDAPSLKMMRNPNVTVRSRGVMEKCTYCVQRINEARITSKREGNRPIADGEIVVACQQACPSNAISFGSLTDESSVVVKKKASGRNYALIADIGTRPRTSYLARLRNPSPQLEPVTATTGDDEHGGGH